MRIDFIVNHLCVVRRIKDALVILIIDVELLSKSGNVASSLELFLRFIIRCLIDLNHESYDQIEHN
jgi:hypothetical protein